MLTAQHFNCFFPAVFMVILGLVLVGSKGLRVDTHAKAALAKEIDRDVLEAFKIKVKNDKVFGTALRTLNELNNPTNLSLRAAAPKKHVFTYGVYEHPNDFWLLKNIYENKERHQDASVNFIPFFMKSNNGWRWIELFQIGDKAVIKAFKAKRTEFDDGTVKMELDHLASVNDHKAQIVFGRTYTFVFIESMIYSDASGSEDLGIFAPAMNRYLAWAKGYNKELLKVPKGARVDTHAKAKADLESYPGVKLPVPKQHFETPL